MAQRTYTVYFAKTLTGEGGEPLSAHMDAAFAQYGEHLPSTVVENERFQVRSLSKVGSVWKGTFAKLRDDTPHYVDHLNEERELALADGASIIEKCQFLYREHGNNLIWQVSMHAGSLSKASAYLSAVLNRVVLLPQVQNTEQLEEILNHDLYEIDFQYAQPPGLPEGVSRWSQRAFDIAGGIGAAYARFTLRARRGQTLAQGAKDYVREMIGQKQYKRVRVRISDGSEVVKLFLAPLKEQFTIEVDGRYPNRNLVFQGLEDAYGRQQDNIVANAA